MNNPSDTEHNCAPDVESDTEQLNGIGDPQFPDQRDVSAVPHVPGLILPTRKSKRQAEKEFITVNATEMRRNKEVKKM